MNTELFFCFCCYQYAYLWEHANDIRSFDVTNKKKHDRFWQRKIMWRTKKTSLVVVFFVCVYSAIILQYSIGVISVFCFVLFFEYRSGYVFLVVTVWLWVGECFFCGWISNEFLHFGRIWRLWISSIRIEFDFSLFVLFCFMIINDDDNTFVIENYWLCESSS